MPALRYRAKPMTKGFTTEGGMRFAFPPYALFSFIRGCLIQGEAIRPSTSLLRREGRGGGCEITWFPSSCFVKFLGSAGFQPV